MRSVSLRCGDWGTPSDPFYLIVFVRLRYQRQIPCYSYILLINVHVFDKLDVTSLIRETRLVFPGHIYLVAHAQ